MNKTNVGARLNKLMATAVQAHQSGRLSQAQKNYEKALKLAPQDAQINYLLGLMFGQQSDYSKARIRLARAVKVCPEEPEYLNHLGLSMVETGEPEAAILHLKKAISINPDDADALCNLGLALNRLEEYTEAEAILQKALSINTTHLDAMINLGKAYQEQSEKQKARSIYYRVLEIDPMNLKVAQNLVAMLPIKTHFDNLQRLIDARLKETPEDRATLMALAKLEIGRENHQRGIEILSSLLKKNINDPELLDLRASAYSQTGEKTNALADFAQLEIAFPEHLGYLVQRVALKKVSVNDGVITQIDKLLADESLSSSRRTSLLFTAAKAYEDIGEIEQSYEFYAQANALKRSRLEYNVEDDIEWFNKIIQRYGQWQGSIGLNPVGNSKPIFIVGMPRSGTSLVEQILDSHSQVKGMGELSILKNAVRQELGTEEGVDYLDRLNDITSTEYQKVREYYLREDSFDEDSPRFQTDKMPFNFQSIGLINTIFPDSQILVCQRQSEDICLSNYKIHFRDEMSFAYSQRELAKYYIAYRQLMDFWLKKLPGRLYEVKYESLVSNPQENVAAMLAYCKLDWEDQCLEFHRSRRPVKTASVTQVHQPMYTSSVNKWKVAEPYLQEMFGLLATVSRH